MRRAIALSLAILGVLLCGEAAAAPKSACDVLTPADLSAAFKVSGIKKDDINSGRNEMTGVDICNWYWPAGRGTDGVEVRIRIAASSDQGALMLACSAEKGDAVEHDTKRSNAAQPLAGLGDEAIYSPAPVGPGGALVVRKGTAVVTITGTTGSKDILRGLAQLALSRL